MELSEKRRALGRGLGALIPSTPAGESGSRPVDVFFKDNSAARARSTSYDGVSRETAPGSSPQVTSPAPSSPAPDVSRETARDDGRTGSTGEAGTGTDGDGASRADVVSRETVSTPTRMDGADGDVSRETQAEGVVSRETLVCGLQSAGCWPLHGGGRVARASSHDPALHPA